MNAKLLTLTVISPTWKAGCGLPKNIPVLMDGESVVTVSGENIIKWRTESNLSLPIFANEINEHMLEEWKFAFQIGDSLTEEELRKASMSKPTDKERNDNGHWGSTVCPCRVRCYECKATYPLFGKFVIKEIQTCVACGYEYEFIDY